MPGSHKKIAYELESLHTDFRLNRRNEARGV